MSGRGWQDQIRERFGIEPTMEAMDMLIEEQGWGEEMSLGATTAACLAYTLKVPGQADIVVDGQSVGSLEEAQATAILRVPADT